MSPETFRPRAFLLEGCPFSFRFWLFMVEAGLGDQIEVLRVSPEAPDSAGLKKQLSEALGRRATFPVVEIEPGAFMADSDALIRHYADANGVDVGELPALAFYSETILPQVVELHRALQQRG